MSNGINFDAVSVLHTLQRLQAPEVKNELETAYAKSYLNDIQQWILGGHAFKQRSGNLFNSIRLSESNVIRSGGKGFNANYAWYIENGNRRARKFPFMFVDEDKRAEDGLEQMSIVLDELIR